MLKNFFFQKLTQETKDWFDRVRQESKETSLLTAHQKFFNATSAHLAEERAKFFDEAREKFHSKMNNGGSEELFGQFVRENQERFSQLLQQQQQQQQSQFSRCHVTTTSTGKVAPAQNISTSALNSQETEFKESSSSLTNGLTTSASTSNCSSPHIPVKTQYRHRALSRDGIRDIYDPIRESNPAPTAAEVVASLLGERSYTSRIPLKQRLVANHLVSRSNHLNNNKTILKKDLIESNAARVHTIKVHRETSDTNISAKKTSCSSDEGNVEDDEIESEVAKDSNGETSAASTTTTTISTTGAEEREVKHEPLQRTHSGSSGLSSSSSSGKNTCQTKTRQV